ncbi:hypothetical protein WG66_008516, partial [Moniliophthora roreri]
SLPSQLLLFSHLLWLLLSYYSSSAREWKENRLRVMNTEGKSYKKYKDSLIWVPYTEQTPYNDSDRVVTQVHTSSKPRSHPRISSILNPSNTGNSVF